MWIGFLRTDDFEEASVGVGNGGMRSGFGISVDVIDDTWCLVVVAVTVCGELDATFVLVVVVVAAAMVC